MHKLGTGLAQFGTVYARTVHVSAQFTLTLVKHRLSVPTQITFAHDRNTN